MDWVSNVDNGGWRPILVTGTVMPGGAFVPAQTSPTEGAAAASKNADLNPIALGEQVFKTATPSFVACHSIVSGALNALIASRRFQEKVRAP